MMSRTPARQAPPPPKAQSLATEMRAIDMETTYFCLAAHQGQRILKLSLEELPVQDWGDVTVGHATTMLQQLYPDCFAQNCRTCHAVDNTLLRPNDLLIEHVQQPSTRVHILPAPLMGAHHSASSWGPPESSSSEPSSEDEPPPHM